MTNNRAGEERPCGKRELSRQAAAWLAQAISSAGLTGLAGSCIAVVSD